jgi:NADH dehydrogenase
MILIAGGTGRLGTRVANELSRLGHDVRVLSRGLTPPAGPLDDLIDVVRGDVREPDSLREPMSGVDVVVSAVQGFLGPDGVTPASVDRQGNSHLIEAAEAAGAAFVLLSIFGAAPDSPLQLARMKYDAERRLSASRCPWTVVRAEAYAETWVEIMSTTAGSSGRPLVFGRGDAPMSFVSVDDVAALVVRAVVDPSLRGRVLEICGPEPVSMSGLAELVMRERGWTGSPRRVPRAALRVMAWTVGMVRPEIGRQTRAALAMDDLPTRRDDALRTEFPELPRTPVSKVVAAV